MSEMQTEQIDNTVFIVQGKIALEAVEDKILVLLDKFKSGFECKTCNETGTLKECRCVTEGHPGVSALNLEIRCQVCRGDLVFANTPRPCPDCRGLGTTLVVPEASKGIPTSGVIVSVGPLCKVRTIGERVLFGPHVGYYLPFKGNAKIRVMREYEPMCKVSALDNNTVLGDFIQYEDSEERV